MTGTGTQADPYIVDTWSDFATAVGEKAVYIEIPKNTVWDMNDILPGGLTSAIKVRCAGIEGNFADIRNLTLSSPDYFFDVEAKADIYRLNFINLTGRVVNQVFYGWDTSTLHCYNCTITGMLANGTFADSNCYFLNDETHGCCINLRFMGNSSFGDGRFQNCLITLDGKSTGTSGDFGAYLNNCYIQGVHPWSSLSITTKEANVFDLEVGEVTSSSSAGNRKQNIINGDKVTTKGSYAASQLTFVTEAQLHDADYLKSVGFPIL